MADRTNELHRVVKLLSRTKPAAAAAIAAGSKRPRGHPGMSSFGKLAAECGSMLKKTGALLSKLQKKAGRGGIFSDSTREVNQLTALIKGDSDQLTRGLEALEKLGAARAPNAACRKHCEVVVKTLRKRLASHSKAFQAALQHHGEAVKRQSDRRKQFSHSGNPVVSGLGVGVGVGAGAGAGLGMGMGAVPGAARAGAVGGGGAGASRVGLASRQMAATAGGNGMANNPYSIRGTKRGRAAMGGNAYSAFSRSFCADWTRIMYVRTEEGLSRKLKPNHLHLHLLRSLFFGIAML